MSDRVHLPLLDVMICTTCELRCTGCTNHIGGLDRLELFPVAEVKADIDRAAAVIRTDLAVILGGEPLQHPKLLELLRHTKASGLADKTRVLTNGIRLHKMPADFWGELEDLKVSIYPGKTPPENVALAKSKQAKLGFDLSFYDVAAAPFRAVLSQPQTPERAQQTYDTCWYRTYTRKIERGHFYRCCTSPTISQHVLGLPPDADGIPLAGLTPDALQAFLDRSDYMPSCTRCHGNTGPLLAQWGEERDRVKWLEASTA